MSEESWNRSKNFNTEENFDEFISSLDWILRIVVAKAKKKELGFVCLFTDGNNNYWYKVSRGIVTALSESLHSLETLIDHINDNKIECNSETKEKINRIYRLVHELYEKA